MQGSRARRWRARVWPTGLGAGIAVCLALALSACAGSLHPAATRTARHRSTSSATAAGRHRVCRPRARAAIAADLHVARNEVRISRQMASNGMPQCTFRVRRPHPVSVVVNVDDGPQAEWRLDRTVEEASQIFGPPPPGWHAPVGLQGLGQYASWFPDRGWLMAANGPDLLTVTIDWPHASRAAHIRLARAAVTPYMDAGRPPAPTR